MTNIVYLRICKAYPSICKIGSTTNLHNRMTSVKTDIPNFDNTTHDLWSFTFESDTITCYDIDYIIKNLSEKHNEPLTKYRGTGGTEFYHIDSSEEAINAIKHIFELEGVGIKYEFKKIDIDCMFNTYESCHNNNSNHDKDTKNNTKTSQHINTLFENIEQEFIGIKAINNTFTEHTNSKGKEEHDEDETIISVNVTNTNIKSDDKTIDSISNSIITTVNKTKHTYTKYNLIYGPCQSGKTRTLINKMSVNKDDYIDVVVTDNSLTQLNQTYIRINKQYKAVQLSSNTKETYYSVLSKVKKDIVNVIMVCGNKTSMNKVLNIIYNTEHKRYRLWLDEADKVSNPNSMYDMINTMYDYDNVHKITFITATPERIENKYNFKIKSTDAATTKSTISNTYSYLKDHTFITKFSPSFKNKEELINIIKTNTKNKDVWFVPSGRKNIQHINFAKSLCKIGINTIIINQSGMNLYTANGIVRKYSCKSKSNTISDILSKVYVNNNLINSKVVVTGYICIGRGITLMSNQFKFTKAIISNIPDDDNLYQLAGRLCGNIETETITIYCSKNTKNRLLKSEGIVI